MGDAIAERPIFFGHFVEVEEDILWPQASVLRQGIELQHGNSGASFPLIGPRSA